MPRLKKAGGTKIHQSGGAGNSGQNLHGGSGSSSSSSGAGGGLSSSSINVKVSPNSTPSRDSPFDVGVGPGGGHPMGLGGVGSLLGHRGSPSSGENLHLTSSALTSTSSPHALSAAAAYNSIWSPARFVYIRNFKLSLRTTNTNLKPTNYRVK